MVEEALARRAEVLDVEVATLGGATWTLRLSRGEDGAEVRRRVGALCQAPAAELTLLCGGAALPDSEEALPWLREQGAVAGDARPCLQVVRARRARALVGCSGGELELWDIGSGTRSALAAHGGAVLCVAADFPAYRAVTGGEDGRLRCWDLLAMKQLSELGEHPGHVWCAALDWESRTVVSGAEDGPLRVWRLEGPARPRRLEGHQADVWALSADWGARRAVSGGRDGSLLCWDLDRCEPTRRLRGHSKDVLCLAASWATDRVASGSADGSVRLWDVGRGTCVAALAGGHDAVWSIGADSSLLRVVSGGRSGRLLVWHPEGRAARPPERELAPCTSPVAAVTLDDAGQRALSGHWDGTVVLWDLDEGRALETLRPPGSGRAECLSVDWAT